jgi:hypothetical protein
MKILTPFEALPLNRRAPATNSKGKKDTYQRNSQKIANLQMLIAMRLDEKNRLPKVIASDIESAANKSIARARLAELERDGAADLAALEKLKE